jgi:hypothetical protein
MIHECLTEVVKSIYPDVEDVEQDIATLVSGGLYRRNRGLIRPLDGDAFWRASPAEALRDLYFALQDVPASSASVERKFAVHERVHNKKRARLSEDAVEAAVLARDLLLQKSDERQADPLPTVTHEQLDFILLNLFTSFMTKRSHLLVEGCSVTTWWEEKSNGKTELKAYRCKLLKKLTTFDWEVQWLRNRSGAEATFTADSDYWILTKEEKTFDMN